MHSKKQITILLGAGFSRSLAGLPLAHELSTKILNELKNHPQLAQYFEKTVDFDYEKFAEFLFQEENAIEYSRKTLSNYPEYQEKEEFMSIAWEIINGIILNDLLKFRDKEPFKARQNAFLTLIKQLIYENYEIHIFDLNHDLILNKIFTDSNLEVDDFFDYYGEFLPSRGMLRLNNKEEKKEHNFKISSKELIATSIFCVPYRGALTRKETSECQIYHYKPHGAVNMTRLLGLPISAGDNRFFDASGLHIIQSLNDRDQVLYNKDFRVNIKSLFQNQFYYDKDEQKCRVVPAFLCQAASKGSILTKISLEYFPEVYSKFASLGEAGSALLTIGYGFLDGHFNIAIRNNYKTIDYKSYSEGEAKILLSSLFEVPVLENLIKIRPNSSREEHNRTVIYSSSKLEDFLCVLASAIHSSKK